MKTRIYQIIPELDAHRIKFMGSADMRRHYGDIVPAEIYGRVYDGVLQTQDLEEIFKIFIHIYIIFICTFNKIF